MRNIDEDNITQAVIASHAVAGDARAREVMTSLVQHLHAFARDVKLTEAEWAEGIRFLTECGRASTQERSEMALLSDMLGLTALVMAVNQRKSRGCTEATVSSRLPANGMPHPHAEAQAEICYVRGQVRALDGAPIAAAEVCIGPPDGVGRGGVLRTDADGIFLCETTLAAPQTVRQDGPAGRLLLALGRTPWRPAHFRFTISAPGYERLVTQVFRQGDPYLDADALFGVRSSLVVDWVRHDAGLTPDGLDSTMPFYTLDFDFILDKAPPR